MLEYFLKFVADGKQAAQETDQVVGALNRIRDAASGIAGALGVGLGVSELIGQFKAAIDLGGHLSDLSKRLSVSPELLQAWKFAAGQGGAQVGDIQTAFRSLTMAMTDAIANKSGDAAQTFGKFGLTDAVLQNASAEKVFTYLSDALGKAPVGRETDMAAMQLLGRGGVDLLAAFRDGFSGDVERALKGGSGLVSSRETVDTLAAAGDKIDEIKTMFEVGRAEAAADIMSGRAFNPNGAMATTARITMEEAFRLALGGPMQLLGTPGRVQDAAEGAVVKQILQSVLEELKTQTKIAQE